MHVTFVPYGARLEVERFLRDMESQVFNIRLWKTGEQDRQILVKGAIRELPFIKGYDLIFPKEYEEMVLNTLTQNSEPNRYKNTLLYKLVKGCFCKALGLRLIDPKYFTNKEVQRQRFSWDREYVSILPLGIRDDVDVVEKKDMGFKGYTHEAL